MWLEFTLDYNPISIEPIKKYRWYATPLNKTMINKELSTAKWDWGYQIITVRKLSTSKLPVKVRRELFNDHFDLYIHHRQMFEMLEKTLTF